ncbi:MAG: hypothetical protein ABI907_07195 [Ramlibacter sp.]
MRFHPILLTLFASAALAQAAAPLREPQAGRYQAAVREAGKSLNTALDSCRAEARRAPSASRRELKDCERTARAAFRQDMKHARALRKQRTAS